MWVRSGSSVPLSGAFAVSMTQKPPLGEQHSEDRIQSREQHSKDHAEPSKQAGLRILEPHTFGLLSA
jgi:hypothetical protein